MKKEAIFAALLTAGLAGKLTALSSDKEFEQHLEDIFSKAEKRIHSKMN